MINQRRLTPALAISIAMHALALLALVLVLQSSDRSRTPEPAALQRPERIVWIPDPRPAARGPPPAYTSDAMRARLQGVVVLNCVVQPDGTCSDIRVMRSLDTTCGLDQQAIASAREWRFRPGLRLGEPVPVQVTLEITFSIR